MSGGAMVLAGDPFTTAQKKPTQGHVQRNPWYHMGGIAMMASVILLLPKQVRTEVWLRPAVDHRGCDP